MPKKGLHREAIPTLIEERLQAWGRVIRAQRAQQRLRAADLCARLEISEATLRRLERGDPGAAASLYLMALQVLGVLDELAPAPDIPQSTLSLKQRVRLPAREREDDYF
ncbi:MAG TPA: helix-turn-helix transcriptional regulator [Noviherbaspirillum sp.]